MTSGGAADALFAHVEALHGSRPWGSVLDAGTGAASLRWIAGLPAERWTAVTASESMRRTALGAVSPRPQDRVLVGDWTDPELLAGERFDVVIADYLLGAIDGFAPHFQDQLFERLRPHVGGVLYAIGQEPTGPESVVGQASSPARPRDPPGLRDASFTDGAVVAAIERVRDACILLAGDRCYREYPLEWVVRSLARAGFVVQSARQFPILRDARFVKRQLGVARSKLPRLDPTLADALSAHIDALEARILAGLGGQPAMHGSDWVVAARPRLR